MGSQLPMKTLWFLTFWVRIITSLPPVLHSAEENIPLRHSWLRPGNRRGWEIPAQNCSATLRRGRETLLRVIPSYIGEIGGVEEVLGREYQ